jgi:hypothetical protein
VNAAPTTVAYKFTAFTVIRRVDPLSFTRGTGFALETTSELRQLGDIDRDPSRLIVVTSLAAERRPVRPRNRACARARQSTAEFPFLRPIVSVGPVTFGENWQPVYSI